MVALSDAAIAGMFGLTGVFVATFGTVVVALIARSTRRASSAQSDVATLVDRFGEAVQRVADLEDREQDCLEALEWAHNRIAALEVKAGMPSSPAPASLRRRRRPT